MEECTRFTCAAGTKNNIFGLLDLSLTRPTIRLERGRYMVMFAYLEYVLTCNNYHGLWQCVLAEVCIEENCIVCWRISRLRFLDKLHIHIGAPIYSIRNSHDWTLKKPERLALSSIVELLTSWKRVRFYTFQTVLWIQVISHFHRVNTAQLAYPVEWCVKSPIWLSSIRHTRKNKQKKSKLPELKFQLGRLASRQSGHSIVDNFLHQVGFLKMEI